MVRKLAFQQQQLIPVTMKRWKGNINISWGLGLNTWDRKGVNPRRLKFQRMDDKIVLWSFTEFSSMHAPNCFRWPKKWGQNGICDEEQSRGKRKSQTVREFHFCLSSDYKVQVMPPWCSCNRHIDMSSRCQKVLTSLLINKYICRGGSTYKVRTNVGKYKWGAVTCDEIGF